MKATLLSTVLVIATLGCARIGSRAFPVTISAETQAGQEIPATAYVVRNDHYLQKGRSFAPEHLPKLFRDFERLESKTPLTVDLPSYQFMIFAVHDGRVISLSEPIVPSSSRTNVVLRFP